MSKNNILIFEEVLCTLHHFVESPKALNAREIEQKLGVHLRTAQRITKGLKDMGYLDAKRVGCEHLYSATEKTKKLFGGAA
ncbi:hypothetical protein [Acinetobacter sp. ANC 5502]